MVKEELIYDTPRNRQQRRASEPADPHYTKAKWSYQTKSELKRKRKLGRS